ncbi:MAG: SMP-30/gluconolactonase/LRE family protein [Hydrogenophaga sp.]|jgi:gluconolactonase|nr:SMP-30/gluconolactonase/LRE family protein [Hydrogenophaga sp.]
MSTPDIRVIASGLEFPEGPVALPDGSFLVVEVANGRLTRVQADGRLQTVAELGDGPNGAALGPDGHVYVCNNGGFAWHVEDGKRHVVGPSADYQGGRIERVNLNTGRAEVIYTHAGDHRLCGPNDLVFDREGGFWFTDLGKTRARDMDRGGVYYARTDGSLIKEVIFPISKPNGVGLSPDEKTLYVAETETGRLWAFDITGPGEVAREPRPSPNGGRLVVGLPGLQMLDSMAVCADGTICCATLIRGGITVVSPDGHAVRHVPMPDGHTTNICFGGPDLKTAYITLAHRGELVATAWDRPGLKLNFSGW